MGDLRKALFNLELLLKEKPLFEIGIFSYCRLLYRSGRVLEACGCVKKYIVFRSGKGELKRSRLLHDLYIVLAFELGKKGLKESKDFKGMDLQNVLRVKSGSQNRIQSGNFNFKNGLLKNESQNGEHGV